MSESQRLSADDADWVLARLGRFDRDDAELLGNHIDALEAENARLQAASTQATLTNGKQLDRYAAEVVELRNSLRASRAEIGQLEGVVEKADALKEAENPLILAVSTILREAPYYTVAMQQALEDAEVALADMRDKRDTYRATRQRANEIAEGARDVE